MNLDLLQTASPYALAAILLGVHISSSGDTDRMTERIERLERSVTILVCRAYPEECASERFLP